MNLKAYHDKKMNLCKHPDITNSIDALTEDEKTVITRFIKNKIKNVGRGKLTDDELSFANQNFSFLDIWKIRMGAINENKPLVYSIWGIFLLILTINSVYKLNNKSEDKNEKNNSLQEQIVNNPISTFCGLEFKSSETIESLDMTTTYITILNCDGTYTSIEKWGTSSASEEEYRNTIGRSSGSFSSFSGTWSLVDRVSDEDAVKLANPGEGSSSDSKLIKYTSNKGVTRYAEIYKSKYNNSLNISPIAYSEDIHDKSYKYEDLNMFNGYVK